jgi:hypothetical protein
LSLFHLLKGISLKGQENLGLNNPIEHKNFEH